MKKIKLPLEMANGVMVTKSLEELKANWDLEKIVSHYGDGSLVTWLNDRYYTDLAEQVQKIAGTGAEAQKQLCAVFGMEFKQDEVVDAEAVAERKRKLDILRQFTSDDEILKNIDHVAFNQEDLSDLLDEKVEKIYLCNGKFSVPLNISGKKYIGVADAEVYIGKDELIDFDKLGISFENVKFDEKYQKLVDIKVSNECVTFKRAMYLHNKAKLNEKYYEQAFAMFKKLSEEGNYEAMAMLGDYFWNGWGDDIDTVKAAECYQKAIDNGVKGLYYNLARLLKDRSVFEKGLQMEKTEYLCDVCLAYRFGSEFLGITKNVDQAISYAEKHSLWGELGSIYYNEKGYENYEKAIEYWIKAVENGDHKHERFIASKYFCHPENERMYQLWLEKGCSDIRYEGALDCVFELIDKYYTIGELSSNIDKSEEKLNEYGNILDKIIKYHEEEGVSLDYIEVARAYAFLGRINEALEIADDGTDYAKKRIWYSVGFVYLYGDAIENNPWKAKEYFLKAKELGETDMDIWIKHCDEEIYS